MQQSDISNISMEIRDSGAILALVSIQLSCGILLKGIRVYEDKQNVGKLFLSFPVRTDNENQPQKTYFPCNNQTREFMTEAVSDKYNKETDSVC